MKGSFPVTQAFDAAASRYEQYAGPQAHAAGRLAARLAERALPEAPRILEIGCGTGLLTRHLVRLYPQATILATDRALSMLHEARANLSGHDRLGFAAMDGERLAVGGGFDLITANLAWQWFSDPMQAAMACRARLNPGGWLALSTLGEGNFAEWRALCAAQGLAHGLRDYPSSAAWRHHFPADLAITEERLPTAHPSALAFLRALRAIGAQAPATGHRPVSAGTLRRLLRGQGSGFVATYHLVYLLGRPSAEGLGQVEVG
ncbi:MAG: methyltransferase domain-containing protein [Magnetococcales bacterium]|nr:methyltransferase domain-containing protein [Magnetococcales bacterium]